MSSDESIKAKVYFPSPHKADTLAADDLVIKRARASTTIYGVYQEVSLKFVPKGVNQVCSENIKLYLCLS